MKRALILLAVVAALAPLSAAPPAPRGSITIERIAAIKYPTNPTWSPDGTRVAFLWDAAGKQDVFVSTPGQPPVQVTDFAVDPDLLQTDITALAWASNDRLLFSKDGRLWSAAPTAKARVSPAQGLADAASFTLSPDRKRMGFVRDRQVWVASMETTSARPVTKLEAPLRASAPVFSLDGQWLAFTAGNSTLAPEDLPWNGPMIQSMERVSPTEARLGIVSVFAGEPWWIPAVGSVGALQWVDGGALVYQETSPDGKTREIKRVVRGELPRTLWRDHDDRWFSPTRRDSRVLASPDGTSVAFISDRPGWMQLYVIPADATSESQARQLTSGDIAVGLDEWSPDGTRILYHHGLPGNPMEKAISLVTVSTGKSVPVVIADGVSLDGMFSPDGRRIVYQHSDTTSSLDLYVTDVAGGSPVRLSDSMPQGLDPADLTPPTAVSFPSRLDGKTVPATLMVSKTLDKSQKHPALVWIHGSGSDQNFLGWHPGSYRMYYSLCQYFAQQGYVILTPDYRGSSGYSRDWSTGVHMALGVADTADVASGADYLKTLDYVDPDRIGVFGLSYGGFLTLQALNTDPTLWRAGVDVAGVVDWATYGPGYVIPRLGTPMENPEIFEVSAPIYHMDKLERPLLILHGTNDRNVQFRDSLRVIDVLLKLGKPFEMGVYPGEAHFFRREHILRDAWTRIADFFDRTVRQGERMKSN